MILGLTGNIASGKSTVAKELEKKGAVIIDADQLAREVVAAGSSTLQVIADEFGSKVLNRDGSLNREVLGDIIFSDADKRSRLNQLIHPAIAELSVQRLNELKKQPDIPLIVYEAPLLFEVGAESRVDKVLLVTIDEQVQRQRLMARNNLSETEASKRIAAQIPQQDKLKLADYVIDNSGTLAETRTQVDRFWPEWVSFPQ